MTVRQLARTVPTAATVELPVPGSLLNRRIDPLLPSDAVLLLLVALAVLYAVEWLAGRGSGAGIDHAELQRDGGRSAPPPSIDVDVQVDRPSGRATVRALLREHLHERLLAVHGYTDDRATELIESGAWTDDPHAGAFVGGEEVDLGLRRRVRLLLRRTDPQEWLFERTVAAIARLEEEGVPVGD